MEKHQLTIRYKGRGKIDRALDAALRDFLETLGYECWASGYDLESGERDLSFDLIEKD